LNPNETDGSWRTRPTAQATTSASGQGTGTLVAPADWSEPAPRVRRTTTLSQAVGEVSDLGMLGTRKLAAPRKLRKSGRLAVPAIGLLGACVAVALVAGGRRSPPVEDGVPSAGVMPAAPMPSPSAPVSPAIVSAAGRDTSPPVVQDDVLVDVTGAPDGLEVTADGHQVSLPLRWLRGTDEHHLVFKANGYRDKAVTVSANRNRLIDLQMLRLSSGPRARPAPSTSTTAQPPGAAPGSYDPDAVAKPAWAR
jgi:hypothetical protein